MNTTSDHVHIALAANHAYAKGLYATVVSMIRASREPERLVFHVFADWLPSEDRVKLVELSRRFGYHGEIDFREPDMRPIASSLKTYHGSHGAYLRLFFCELLPELEWVLWSDVDALWFRDPAELWDLRDSDFSLMWVKDIRSSRLAAAAMAMWHPGFDSERYACTGVMLMNLARLRKQRIAARVLEFSEHWGTPHFADQDMFNEFCYDDAVHIDPAWDCMYPGPDWRKGLVIHFNCLGAHFGEDRPSGFSPLLEIWFRYYREVVLGEPSAPVTSWLKRLAYNCLALLYPIRRLFATLFDPISPWGSDFVQRLIFFSWLRRKPLWK